MSIMPEKKLGFGFMRLPTQKDGTIDMEQVNTMVDLFLQEGFTYFDTAYAYMNSQAEDALRKAVVERYPRDSFVIADKLPMWYVEKKEDVATIFNTQLDRTGAGYFDYYLLHSLYQKIFEQSEEMDAWNYLLDMKAQGKIKHLGFSFHDTAECLDEILRKHPEVEFVQLQINYADWDSDSIQSRLCYEIARKYDKPVIIMEPVKGGSLAALPQEAKDVFLHADSQSSIASWAMRFAGSLEGVIAVLSGMSTLDQVKDNTSIMSNFTPLTQEDQNAITQVQDILAKIPTIPCTACDYCVEGCPQRIPIPSVIKAVNTYTTYQNLSGPKGSYLWAVTGHGKASDCIACGACEERCPQHIPIIAALAKAAELFDT